MKERIRTARAKVWSWVAAGLAVGIVGLGVLAADPPRKGTTGAVQAPAGTASKATNPGAAANRPAATSTKSPSAGVNEPIAAHVNNEVITYKALAEECIARQGPEVLETMIAKMLVMQACQARGIKVTAAEVDEEIGRTAQKFNTTREAFLKMLKEKKNIDPKRYNEDIVLPGLALKKLATPFVKVNEEDIERGFEAMYGEKVKCRWIMFDDPRIAMQVWNELRASVKKGENKVALGEFEHQVTKWSTDVGSRATGGQIQPIAHHTTPRYQELENAAFAMKEDGEISKVVQLDNSYVILYREALIPPSDVKLEKVRADLEAEIYEAKLQDQIGRVFLELRQNATIENMLTGEVSTPEKNSAGTDKAGKGKEEAAKVSSVPEAAKKTQPTIRR